MFEDCNPHGANAMETLRDYVRKTADIPDPAGYWYHISDGLIRNKVSDMVNHFLTCIEKPGVNYDERGAYRCVICGEWNGLHHDCEITNLIDKTYSFNEFCDGFLYLIEKYNDRIPKY